MIEIQLRVYITATNDGMADEAIAKIRSVPGEFGFPTPSVTVVETHREFVEDRP